ncbi:MAG TPA: TRAP transporter small permease [Ideonella sp.]|nr:TRAP transporter small permease [Ideonella sp.]
MKFWLLPLARVFALIAGVIACGVAGMTVWSIVRRAAISQPVSGDVELTQFGVALCISLCLPWCQLHGGNIIVDFFTQKLPQRANAVLDAFGALLMALMCGLLSWRTAVGAVAVQEVGETSMILSLPMWWVYVSLAPGLALSGLIALVQMARALRGQAMVDPT